MFENLSQKITNIFSGLRRHGALSEADVTAALREVRIALLEADVALPVIKDFIEKVKAEAIGQEVLQSITPAQMVIKIVNDQLIALLGLEAEPLNLAAQPPVVIMMVGLQGSGKTTSTGKLAKWLGKKQVMLASLDVYRPAAQDQLEILGKSLNIDSLPIVPGEKPIEITKRALQEAKRKGAEVLILDTAGRLHIDEALMDELKQVHALAKPQETLLVVDSMMGQDAVNVATNFKAALPLTGIILTRIDGDARGGAALSMRHVTGCPIKFIGSGEKLDQFEVFHPDRIAGRILGMGDIVTLVEKAAERLDKDTTDQLNRRLQKGIFDLSDMAAQLRQVQKIGGMSGIMSMLPGADALKGKMSSMGMDDKLVKKQLAIIGSMTPRERKYPKLLNASRKRRVANGSGTAVQDINVLLKQFESMGKMMKKMNKLGQKGMLRQGLSNFLKP
jgi:signal recognition particle subunit SRP54